MCNQQAVQERYEKMKTAKDLNKELKETFPASDPPSITQPGSGITGPEDLEKQPVIKGYNA